MADVRRRALLVMDVQRFIVDRYAERDPTYLSRLAATIDRARSVGLPVIYVVVRFRPGHPEVAPANAMFSRFLGDDTLVEGTHGAAIADEVAPRPDDVVVVKRRVSAFAGSDLDEVLRAGGSRHLVLTGIATSGVVLSTAREAADRDHELTVLHDLCLDADPRTHAVLVQEVLPRQATVTAAADWLAGLEAAPVDRTERHEPSEPPRTPLIAADDATGKTRAVLDEVAAARGGIAGNVFRAMAANPDLTQAISRLGTQVRFSSPLEREELELVILTVARELGCTYEWTHHLAAAERAGLSPAEARARLDAPPDDRTRLLVQAARTLAQGRDLSATQVAALQDTVGAAATVSLVVTVGYYVLLGRFVNSFAIPIEDGTEREPF